MHLFKMISRCQPWWHNIWDSLEVWGQGWSWNKDLLLRRAPRSLPAACLVGQVSVPCLVLTGSNLAFRLFHSAALRLSLLPPSVSFPCPLLSSPHVTVSGSLQWNLLSSQRWRWLIRAWTHLALSSQRHCRWSFFIFLFRVCKEPKTRLWQTLISCLSYKSPLILFVTLTELNSPRGRSDFHTLKDQSHYSSSPTVKSSHHSVTIARLVNTFSVITLFGFLLTEHHHSSFHDKNF